MPQLRDITVRVTDAEGHEFEEWGIQQLRKQNKVSAYITSRSEAAFRITIQPKIPFLTSQLPTVEERGLKREFEDDNFGDSSTNFNLYRKSLADSRVHLLNSLMEFGIWISMRLLIRDSFRCSSWSKIDWGLQTKHFPTQYQGKRASPHQRTVQ